MRFRKREQQDLLKSWLVISLAFAIFLSVNQTVIFMTLPLWFKVVSLMVVALVTVGLGFLVHELAHKFVAEKENCHAEYKANNTMLIISLVFSPWFIFAAPGAVHVSGHPNPEQSGRTAVAGPVANLVLALLFLILLFILPPGWKAIAGFGGAINALLGLFNLIPMGGFDGLKVLVWNKIVYGITVSVAVILSFITYNFVSL